MRRLAEWILSRERAAAATILAALVGYAGLVFLPRERAAAIAACRAELEAIAESRHAAIGLWVESRLGDAANLAALPSVHQLLADGAPGPRRAAALREVAPLLGALVGSHGVARALVVDRSMRVAAATGGAASVDAALVPDVGEVLRGGAARASFVTSESGAILAVFAQPVTRSFAGTTAGATRGAVVVAEDPARWLYPYLGQRLISSATSESLLARRDGGEVLFLSPLRHESSPPLALRRPLALPGLAAAEGLRGGRGFGEYRDYRGAAVFAALRGIRGTDWLLVAKIDRSEALAPFYSRLRGLGLVAAIVLASAFALAILARRAHRASRAAELASTTARLNERFRIAAESVSDLVYEWDLAERVDWFGDVDGLLGWGPGEYPRTAAGHVATIHPDDVASVMDSVERHRRGEGPYEVEYRVLRKDGSYAWWAVRGTAVRDANGVPVHWVGAASDVSGRKEAEERLLHLNAVLRAIRNVNQLIVREKDVPALLAQVCGTLVETRGYHGAWVAVLAGHAAGHLASAGIEPHATEMRELFEGGRPPECARRALEREGVQAVHTPATECGRCTLASTYSGRAGLGVRVAAAGRTLGVLCVSVPSRFADDPEEHELLHEVAGDLGLALQSIETERERRLAERDLRAADQVMNESIAALSVADRQGSITRVNPAFLALWGLARREDAVGRPIAAFFADPGEAAMVVEALDRGGRWEGEFRARRPDGSVFDCRGLATTLHDADGGIVGYQSTNIDVSEQRRAEQALAASERKYRHFFEQGLAGHYVSTPDGRLLSCNRAFARLLGFASAEHALGVDVRSLYATPAAREEFLGRLSADGRVDRLETELVRRDGSRVCVLESAVEVGGAGPASREIHGFVIDDTDRRTAHEELLQAQKMEAVGRLAGGVAHDFNNLLGVILGHTELLQRRRGPDAAGAELEEVRLAAERGGRLTRQLLAFSRRQVLKPRVLDLNAVVRALLPMLSRLIGEDVRLVATLADVLGRVRADEGQIEQVLMNLAVNARDAMPQGGTLTIETAGALSGEVTITIRDTGHGMDAETIAHAFEPFFTTKPAGVGTGLGLATVHGIVLQSGGRIEVESEPSKGTAFRISLPATEDAVEPAPAADGPSVAVGGHETILLVEDDAALRAVTREILADAGYAVLAAAGPDDALALEASHGDGIDLLLSDVVMPGLSGPALAAEILVRRPGLRVLYASGYTAEAMSRYGLGQAGAQVLQKPFAASELLRAVRATLGGEAV